MSMLKKFKRLALVHFQKYWLLHPSWTGILYLAKFGLILYFNFVKQIFMYWKTQVKDKIRPPFVFFFKNAKKKYNKKIKCKLSKSWPKWTGLVFSIFRSWKFYKSVCFGQYYTKLAWYSMYWPCKGREISLCDQNFSFVLSLKKKLSTKAVLSPSAQ